MRVGIDIDGVLYPWTDCVNEAVVSKFGVPDPGPHRHWDWLKERLTSDEWAWVWSREGQREAFSYWGRSYHGVSEAFGRILKSGHECHFVTHRDPAIVGVDTAIFLEKTFPGCRWAGLHVMKGGPKHELMGWDVFIDDKAETVEDFLLQTRAQVFTPVRPWNTCLEAINSPRLIPYSDPQEVADWVLSQ